MVEGPAFVSGTENPSGFGAVTVGSEGEGSYFFGIGRAPHARLFLGGEECDTHVLNNFIDRLVREGGKATVTGGFVLHGEMFAGVDANIASLLAVVHAFIVRNGGRFQEETFAGGRFDGVATDEVALFVDAGDINVLIDRCGLRNDGHKAERDEAEKTD